jgi:hypothetical protein
MNKNTIKRFLADEDLAKRANRYFNSPAALIRFLDKRGFNQFEISSMLDSTWLFEAVEEFGAGAGGGKGNTGTFKAFLDKYTIEPLCPRVNKLVLSKVTNAVANSEGVPCFPGVTVIGGQKILVALGTPASCDPTTETYACM